MGSDKMGLSWFSPQNYGINQKSISQGISGHSHQPFQELWCSPGIWRSHPRVRICIPAPLTGLKSLEKRTWLLSCWGCPSSLSSWGSDRSREGFSCRSPGCGGGTAKLCREGWINDDKIPLIAEKKKTQQKKGKQDPFPSPDTDPCRNPYSFSNFIFPLQ